jgi:hypothetical protein
MLEAKLELRHVTWRAWQDGCVTWLARCMQQGRAVHKLLLAGVSAQLIVLPGLMVLLCAQ